MKNQAKWQKEKKIREEFDVISKKMTNVKDRQRTVNIHTTAIPEDEHWDKGQSKHLKIHFIYKKTWIYMLKGHSMSPEKLTQKSQL